MSTLFKRILQIAKKVKSNITFYPIIIGLFFLAFAVFVLSIENSDIVIIIKDSIPTLFIQDLETARTILSVLIGSILSLTVFSFSMVMLVLNQASSNFSPRLLPGLLSNRNHQFILGFYVGSIIYFIVILISLGAHNAENSSLGLSVMLAAIFGLGCVTLFVLFIHSISKEVQVQNIIEKQYRQCVKSIEQKVQKAEDTDSPQETENWDRLTSNHSGYYQGYNDSIFSEKLTRESTTIEILIHEGEYVLAGQEVIAVESKFNTELEEDAQEGLSFSPFRHSENGYFDGMLKLMEIAVKAMSPGINDPGTALDVINRLNKLFEDHIHMPNRRIMVTEKNGLSVIINEISLEKLLQGIYLPIRQYSTSDATVSLKLATSLVYLYELDATNMEEKKVLEQEMEALVKGVENGIIHPGDRKAIRDMAERLIPVKS